MSSSLKISVIKWIGLLVNVTITAGAGVGLFYCGVSWFAFGLFVVSSQFCMLTHEIGYHRYFAHKSFETSRRFQFILGLLAELAPIRGPIWWAANHRDHHKFVDTQRDPHSPVRGTWKSYMGWVYDDANIAHTYDNAAELTTFPELVFIDKFFFLPMLVSFALLFGVGAWLETAVPELGTSGLQLLVWGGFLRMLYPIHTMALINFFAHHPRYHFGYRNFGSRDASRNLPILGYLGAGVGWHNNHHRAGGYATTKVFWWELDFSGWVIRQLERKGVIWEVKWPPEAYRREAERYRKRRDDDADFEDPYDTTFAA